VFLYGLLAGGRTRAQLRHGGVTALAARVASGEVTPDFGPAHVGAAAGAVLVAARPPLVAFNLELAAPATLEDARRVAARLRESGPGGLPGLRAIGLALTARGGVAQVSCNVEDHLALPLARLIAEVDALAPVAVAEVVGLPPAAAFVGYPDSLPTRGRRTLEEAL
jgi:glutamate formiminotransferase